MDVVPRNCLHFHPLSANLAWPFRTHREEAVRSMDAELHCCLFPACNCLHLQALSVDLAMAIAGHSRSQGGDRQVHGR